MDQTNVMQSSTTSSSSEVVYGEKGSNAGSDESRVMSEKVQIMASSIYREFETMIRKFGEDSVKELMPLVVNVLESLDLAYLEKEEHLVDLEMLKEDNEQLMNQYEREKQLRKSQDAKCIEIEDSMIEQIRELETKIESLESITRMLELKAKNATDHANRLEEREADQKIEFEKLHDRYNDLLRTHIEHVERTKYLMGADKFDMMQSLPMPNRNVRNNTMAISVDANVRGISDIISSIHMSQSTHADVNLANHISNERDWQEEFGQTDLMITPRDGVERQVSAESRSIKEEDEHPEQEAQPSEKEPEDSLSADLTVNDTFIGMGREVENLIRENTELMETKNALNIVKNDLIARVDELSSEHEILREEIRSLEMVKLKMSERIRELEEHVKSLKEKQSEDEDQEDIPMAQRKRFTRVEMARVLMERNQYKEKLMELQDAVKYTEMQRAKRMSSQGGQSKGRIWDFFSGLFGDSPSPNQNNGHRKLTRRAEDQSLRRKAVNRNFDLENDSVQERRMAERRQQYKAVSQHMKKDDESRTQAYGWSIPSTVDTASTSSAIPVPIWCAAGVTLLGGRTRDGGYIVGESVFYNDDDSISITEENTPTDGNTVDLLDYEIRTQQKEKMNHENAFWEYSSLIWVCSSNEKRSFVTIFDGNNPNNILECFNACDAHILSVASIPGVRKSDYPNDDQHTNLIRDGSYFEQIPNDIANEKEQFGAVQWIPVRRDTDEPPTYISVDEKASPKRERNFSVSTTPPDKSLESADEIVTESVKDAPPAAQRTVRFNMPATPMGIEAAIDSTTPICTPLEKRGDVAGAGDTDPAATETETKAEAEKTHTGWTGLPPHIRDGLSKYEGVGEITTALPTMWMGLENDYIQIHSGVTEWRKCLRKIRMADAVLSILHYKGRVFAALANGSIAIFHRDSDGNWADNGYHVLFLGKGSSAVSQLTIVSGRIWAAYRNCVVIIEPKTLMIENVFVAHPRRDSQIRHMVWIGDGVWISVRLDSTIRLYHAHNYQHLQDVDIEPYITKMLGLSRIDFPQLRITALLVLNKRLWIGTGSGVIISVPLSEDNQAKIEVIKTDHKRGGLNEEVRGPGGLIRVYGDPRTERVSPGSFIPYCNMTQAQLSFHGHKDAVRFFLAVPAESNTKMLEEVETRKILITSGGDGYIDLRLGEDDEQRISDQPRIRDMSHLIVWELEIPNPRKFPSS